MPELTIGEEIEIVYEDAPRETRRGRVTRFMSDEDLGIGPEIEDYVACWVEVALDGVAGDGARQILTMGTDSRYSINGRHVQLRKA
jgi:hypothetical protein